MVEVMLWAPETRSQKAVELPVCSLGMLTLEGAVKVLMELYGEEPEASAASANLQPYE